MNAKSDYYDKQADLCLVVFPYPYDRKFEMSA